MKITAIVQARMGSTRLPGKIMKNIKGKPIIEHVISRLRSSRYLNDIVIATTVNACDDIIITEAEKLGVSYYRGSENDVLSRYYYAAKENGADIILRITSDCPVIDSDIIDKMIIKYIKLSENNEIDYMSNTLERTFPRGLDAEIIPFPILEKTFKEAQKPYEREHVTPYIYQNPQKFRLCGFKNDIDYSNYRWTLDTPEDFQAISQIYNYLYREGEMFYLDEIVELIKKHQDIHKINEHIEQKKLSQ